MDHRKLFTDTAGGIRLATFGGLKKVSPLEQKNPFENIYIDRRILAKKPVFSPKLAILRNFEI